MAWCYLPMSTARDWHQNTSAICAGLALRKRHSQILRKTLNTALSGMHTMDHLCVLWYRRVRRHLHEEELCVPGRWACASSVINRVWRHLHEKEFCAWEGEHVHHLS